MAQRTWFPDELAGSKVVLRRHVPGNVAAFLRWYADPEIARLARYQATPMRPEEIERFFTARVVGPNALAMAVHDKATDRLVGTCAFSQLDGENGSALYHITIGEQDAWGHGFGTEATQLMLDHAFGTLGLHRIALYVFEFNERAIRAYQRCGFFVEGRSRESIWRDGRWWDEMAMSVLESDWRKRREAALRMGGAGVSADGAEVDERAPAKPAAAEPTAIGVGEPVADTEVAKPAAARVDEPVAAGRSDRVRRTLGRWR
jgi:RimJ/RimL family protein N-acetyltransferase